jgi:hypothetical protein
MYTIHLIKDIGKGYFQYLPMVSFNSLIIAKSYIPDLKLFAYGFNQVGLVNYLKIPSLDTVTINEVLDFLAYQFNSFSALKDHCENLVEHSGMKNSFKTGKELYTTLREKFQVQAYLNWLTSRGYSASSYMAFVFEIFAALGHEKIIDKATEYDKREKAFYD